MVAADEEGIVIARLNRHQKLTATETLEHHGRSVLVSVLLGGARILLLVHQFIIGLEREAVSRLERHRKDLLKLLKMGPGIARAPRRRDRSAEVPIRDEVEELTVF